jgi:nickel/cobalt exporter
VGQDLVLYLGAMALGALHAFEPGHGKTIIAAYMIGTRGRAIDGILLGFIVTFTHTFSVIILGFIAKLLSQTYSEEQLHGWLGLFSALLILSVGLWMLRRRLSGQGHTHFHPFGKGHGHGHAHAHDHDHHHDRSHSHNHHGHTHHDHPHDSSKPVAESRPGTWNLLVLGISGGLVPCPAAIATLLAAIAAGRIAKGLTMAIFFSLGLGLVMMTIGVVLSQAGRLTRRFESHPDFSRRMGIVSAIIITMLGILTLFHSIRTLWF